MSERLTRLKQRLAKVATVKGNIIFIDAQKFRCQNKFHPAKEPVLHIFTSRIKEIECECGTVYKHSSLQNK